MYVTVCLGIQAQREKTAGLRRQHMVAPVPWDDEERAALQRVSSQGGVCVKWCLCVSCPLLKKKKKATHSVLNFKQRSNELEGGGNRLPLAVQRLIIGEE